MIINLSNIILKVNIQINKYFDLNEYFIAIGINVQCLYTIMALGHIYTNSEKLTFTPDSEKLTFTPKFRENPLNKTCGN